MLLVEHSRGTTGTYATPLPRPPTAKGGSPVPTVH